MTQTALSKVASQLLSQLMEHCDTAQLFVTRVDPETGATTTLVMGHGNALARIKQAEDWVIAMDAPAAEEEDDE